MGKQFDIDEDHSSEASGAYFAEEEEMKLGIHPTQIKDRIKDWFYKNDDGNVDITRLDEWTDSTVKVYIRRTGMLDGKLFGIFNYINNEFDSIDDPVDVLITENDEARISIDLWFSEHEIDKDFYIEETTPESNLVKVYIDDDDEYGEFSKFFGIFDTDKCDFIDDQMSISENMEFFNIKDNPFDIIAHATMEILRTAMFSSHRYRNEGVGKNLWDGYESYIRWMQIIEQQYDLLDKVNEKTIKFLRESSYFGYEYGTRFNEINHYILDLEKDMATVYSHTVPFHGLEYEKIRLCEDSDEYQRLIFLINLTDRINLDQDHLSRMIDVINNGEDVLTYGWLTRDGYDYMKRVIDNNHLSTQDIEYMISYLEKKEKGFSANS